MDKQGLKSRYHRFRQWQEQPFNYQRPTDEVHHCNNCGEDFTGNFCPVCSQKAGLGRIGWRSVHQGIMDIWGLGTRSLLYSIWQLLLRPGHIISDYIDGKRQVSFPPVKMLFIIAVIYSMVYYWLLPTIFKIQVEPVITPEDQVIMGDMVSWLETNYSWFALIMALLAVLPTWVMFRYSPRHTLHTLPEGFFIQVSRGNDDCIQFSSHSHCDDRRYVIYRYRVLCIWDLLHHSLSLSVRVWHLGHLMA